jgi:SRSO17 transposase
VGKRRAGPARRDRSQLSATLAAQGKEAGFPCRAVVADCAYSTSDDWYFALREARLPYVVAHRPHRGTWARADQPHPDRRRTRPGRDRPRPSGRLGTGGAPLSRRAHRHLVGR